MAPAACNHNVRLFTGIVIPTRPITMLVVLTIRRPRSAGRAPGKPSVPFLGTFRESGELLCKKRVLVLPQHSSKVTPPEPKPLHPPPSPCPASLTPRPPSQLFSLCLPSQPFFPWNQGPWSTPPSTRPAPVGTPPHPTGHPSKKVIFFFLYALRNLLRPWGPCPYHLPPRNRSPCTPPPSPCPASLTPRPPSQLFSLCLPSQPFPDPFPWNQGPWSTPPSTRPAPVGTPPTPQGILQIKPFFFFLYALETTKIRHTLRNLLRPWGPCPYHLPPRNRSPCTPPEPLPRLSDPPSTKPGSWVGAQPFCQANPSLTPSSGIKALGLPPPGQLRWAPPPPHRASFKKSHFSSFCTR